MLGTDYGLAYWAGDHTIKDEMIRRQNLQRKLKDEAFLKACYRHYPDNPCDYINDWAWTYDPRDVVMPWKPFLMFQSQVDITRDIVQAWKDQKPLIIEKSRDQGATWIAGSAIPWWMITWHNNQKITIGSRKEMLVDSAGNMDCIFEKIRCLIRYTPPQFRQWWNEKKTSRNMAIINPKNGTQITGEAGDNMGRGGRSSYYCGDEFAFVERAESVDASISNNARCIIYVSSANGQTVFYNKIRRGNIKTLKMHWKDDPRKNTWESPSGESGQGWKAPTGAVYPWYEGMKAEYDEVIIAQEIDIDHKASVDKPLIHPDWIGALIEHDYTGIEQGETVAGLDVADGGADSWAHVIRRGGRVIHCKEYRGNDELEIIRDVDRINRELKVDRCNYDAIGVGSQVKTALRQVETTIKYFPILVSETATSDRLYKDRDNRDVVLNIRAEACWRLRQICERTHRERIKGELVEGLRLSIPRAMKQLIDELSVYEFAYTENGLIKIQSKDDLKKKGIKSPNCLEALYLTLVRGRQTVGGNI